MGRSKEKASSQHKAHAIALLNQQASPLLRLPGEIRNSIYSLVLGGITIEVGNPCTCGENCTSFDVSIWAHEAPCGSRVHLDLITDILLVSRQVYSETKLLLFKLNKISIFCEDLVSFRRHISRAQWNAIATFKIPQGDVRSSCNCPNCVIGDWVSIGGASAEVGHPGLKCLSAAVGLELVIVEDWCPHTDEHQDGTTHKKEVTELINKSAGNREIKVIFEECPASLGSYEIHSSDDF
ncbi:hypothetical protein NX059_003682 [Plenodomus lindquistii]|nr:hypothetical protein NX059_003682 [Plenodomus lindquistii]